jgi:hypothetical protein
VTVTVETSPGIYQSFLIMDGDTVGVQLQGYTLTETGPSIVTVPVTVRARIA